MFHVKPAELGPPFAKGGSGDFRSRVDPNSSGSAITEQAIKSSSGSASARGRGVAVSNWVYRPTAPQTPSLRGTCPPALLAPSGRPARGLAGPALALTGPLALPELGT